MSSPAESPVACAVCGKPCEDDQVFAHLYRAGGRFPICSPACFERFEGDPDKLSSGDGPRGPTQVVAAEAIPTESG